MLVQCPSLTYSGRLGYLDQGTIKRGCTPGQSVPGTSTESHARGTPGAPAGRGSPSGLRGPPKTAQEVLGRCLVSRATWRSLIFSRGRGKHTASVQPYLARGTPRLKSAACPALPGTSTGDAIRAVVEPNTVYSIQRKSGHSGHSPPSLSGPLSTGMPMESSSSSSSMAPT